MKRDLYKILGVDQKATFEEIKKAYRSQSQKLHPDKNPDDPDAAEKLLAVQQAYAILKDSEKRKHYDDTGEEENWLQNQALGTIAKLYATMAEKCNYARKNYIIELTKSLQNSLRECKAEIGRLEVTLNNIDHLMDNTKGDKMLVHGLQRKQAQIRHQKTHAEEAEKVMMHALEILDKCEYTGDIPQAPTMTVTMRGPVYSHDPYIS